MVRAGMKLWFLNKIGKFWNFCKVFGSQTVTLKQTNDTQTAWNQNFQKIQNSDSFTYEPISSFSGLLHDQRQKFEHFAKEFGYNYVGKIVVLVTRSWWLEVGDDKWSRLKNPSPTSMLSIEISAAEIQPIWYFFQHYWPNITKYSFGKIQSEENLDSMMNPMAKIYNGVILIYSLKCALFAYYFVIKKHTY